MQSHADGYRFGPQRTCPDGVVTDFVFTQTQDAEHAWRYPDLTGHVHYLSTVLRQTVEHEMVQEALALRQHGAARAAIKILVEMPDQDADRIIRSLQQSQWTVSNKLRKELPEIFGEAADLSALQAQIVTDVREVFKGGGMD